MFANPQSTNARLREAVMVCLVFTWIGSVFALFPAPASPTYPAWPDGMLLTCATFSVLLSLNRHLPWQNVVVVALIVAVIAGGVFGGFAYASQPGRSLVYADKLGPKFFGCLPWTILPAWLVIFMAARGVALLIMRPWRNGAHYGWWLIGVTTLVVLNLGLGLEPMASQVKHYWRWEVPAWNWNWQGLLWPALALWCGTALLIQLLALPWLISKKPVAPPPDFHPLFLWFLINWWTIAGNSTRGLLSSAGLSLGTMGIITALALRGGLHFENPVYRRRKELAATLSEGKAQSAQTGSVPER